MLLIWNICFRCEPLNELNLSNFNTDNSINLGHMFHGCKSLKELNISNFITKNVNNMKCMLSN